jgi:hypothetical protein
MILACVVWTLLSPWNYHNSFKDPKMSKQGTAGKRKNVTLTVPQKLTIVRGLKVAQAEVWLWLRTMLGSQL